MRKLARQLIILGCLLSMACMANGDTPKAWFADLKPQDVVPTWAWADWFQAGVGQFVNRAVYKDPLNCLGAPSGGEVYAPKNSATIGYYVSLGDRVIAGNKGWLVLGFSTPVTDDPRNPYGLDFIVFSNACFRGDDAEDPSLYADPTRRWQEPAFVEISQDLSTWYLIRPNILPSELVPGPLADADTGDSTTMLRGYAEYTPSIHLPTVGHTDPFSNVIRTAEELYTIPDRPSLPEGFNSVRFDYVSGGGDAMDIADAVLQSAPGVPAHDAFGDEIKANIGWFRYVRMTDAVAGDSFPDLGEISAEIDAVSAVRPALSIGEAKQLDEGGYAFVTEAIVTAVLPDAFFIESPNRASAMKVIYNTGIGVDGKLVEVGDKVSVSGHLTKVGGKFKLPDPMWSCTSTGNDLPAPLGFSIKTLASDMAYGMRVRTYGKVTSRGTGYCVINDNGRTAKVIWSNGYIAPAINSYVCVTGICDREEGTGATTIIAIDPSADIKTY